MISVGVHLHRYKSLVQKLLSQWNIAVKAAPFNFLSMFLLEPQG